MSPVDWRGVGELQVAGLAETWLLAIIAEFGRPQMPPERGNQTRPSWLLRSKDGNGIALVEIPTANSLHLPLHFTNPHRSSYTSCCGFCIPRVIKYEDCLFWGKRILKPRYFLDRTSQDHKLQRSDGIYVPIHNVFEFLEGWTEHARDIMDEMNEQDNFPNEHRRKSVSKTPAFQAGLQSVFRVKQPRIRPNTTSGSASTAEYDEPPFHTRRAHKKSRAGCKNCKRRRIKVRLTNIQHIRSTPYDLRSTSNFCMPNRSVMRPNLNANAARTTTSCAITQDQTLLFPLS